MKVIFSGSRYLKPSKQALADLLDQSGFKVTEVVTGGSGGVDDAAFRFAKDLGLPITIFYAGWGQFGKSAGPERNRRMAQYAEALIYFWDGKSKGTKNMIEEARDMGLKIHGETPVYI